jgi:hypothetical protein
MNVHIDYHEDGLVTAWAYSLAFTCETRVEALRKLADGLARELHVADRCINGLQESLALARTRWASKQ